MKKKKKREKKKKKKKKKKKEEEYTSLTTIVCASFSDNVMKFENDLIVWETYKETYL